MTDELLKNFEFNLQSLTLIPASGGVFEVELDGELLFSKKQLGRHPNAGEITALIKARLGAGG